MAPFYLTAKTLTVKDGDLQGDGQAGAGSQIRLAGDWRSFQWVRDCYLDGTYIWPEYLAKLQSPTLPPAPRVYANTNHTYWSAWDLAAAVRILPSLGNANLQWVSPNKLRLTTGLPGGVTAYEQGRYRAVLRREIQNSIVYITYDDGPYVNDSFSPTIDYDDMINLLNVIQDHNNANPTHQVHVTLMFNGVRIEQDTDHEDITRRSVADFGHTLGNHSYRHPQPFSQRSADAIRHEVIRNRLVMIKVVGSAGSITNALRPPGENYIQIVFYPPE
jgi:hypothetical protein